MLNFLRRLFSRKARPVVIDERAAEQPRPKKRIRPELLARAGVTSEAVQKPFTMPKPMPGVIPAAARLATDEAMTQPYAAAMEDAYSEGLVFMGYPALAQLTQRAEYRRPVEILAKEMTRKWLKIQSTGDTSRKAAPTAPPQPLMPEQPPQVRPVLQQQAPALADPAQGGEDPKAEKIRQLETAFDRLGVKEAVREALEHDGFFGRGQIYVDVGVDDPAELKMRLSESAEKIGKGALKKLRVIDPLWTYPGTYNSNDPLSDNFFKPTTWFVLGREIHQSRFITLVSREVPDLLKPAYVFGGLPLTQMIKPYVDNWLNTRQSVADIVQAFTVWVLKTDMAAAISGEDSDGIIDRLELFNRFRNNRGVFALDKDDEDFQNVTASLAGLHELQAQSQEHMSAATGIPLVKLFGISPSGLNASSDGEIRTFYDGIEAEQESTLKDGLRRLLNIVQLSEFGEIDPEIGFAWEPLMSADPKEIAEIRKIDAERDGALIDKGVLEPAEVRERIANDEDSPYASLDLSHVPEPPEPPGGLGLGMPPGMTTPTEEGSSHVVPPAAAFASPSSA